VNIYNMKKDKFNLYYLLDFLAKSKVILINFLKLYECEVKIFKF